MHSKQYNSVGAVTALTDLNKVGREDAFFPSQLTLQPSFLTCLGDIFDHIPLPHCELVVRVALKVDQHQHLCSASTNGAEN